MNWRERRHRSKARRLLARGRSAKAIRLLEKTNAWDALADVYEGQGELRRAAEAAVKAGAYGRAADILERAEAFSDAAELWVLAADRKRAASALEQAGDYERAADMYVSLDMPSQAAALMADLERYDEAGRLYELAGEVANASKVYRAAQHLEKAAHLLEESGDSAGAAELYCETGDKASAARLFAQGGRLLESAQCFAELGRHKEAGKLFETAGHTLRAAQAYEKDNDTLEESAALYGRVLRPELAWQRELNSSPTCLSVSEKGSRIALGCAARRVQLVESSGERMWTYKPGGGGVPRCVALSADCHLAVGCDDGRLYFLDEDKTVLWSYRLPGEAARVSVDRSGERILCSTKNNRVLCLSGKGAVGWEYRSQTQIWDVALSADGGVAAVGTANGLVLFKAADGKRLGQYEVSEWVHSVSLSADGGRCALGVGMHGVELVDLEALKTVWSAQDESPVHNVVLTAGNGVFSVGDETALLRREDGAVACRYEADTRLLGGDIDDAERVAAFRCAERKLTSVNLLHCKSRAAANYEKAGNIAGAASIYEAMGEHARAAELFKSMDRDLDVARNLEMDGRALEAAELYRSAGEFGKAAMIFEQHGQRENAAACFAEAGQLEKAAESFEQSGNLAQAARCFEQAGQYGKAGRLYKAINDVPAAMSALTEHLNLHPDDAEKHLELGVLMVQDGQYDTAIERLQRAVTSENHRRQALMHMAECFMAKNLYDIAVDRYKACLDENEDVSADNIEIFYGIGRAHELAGRYGEARRVYERILAVDYHYRDVEEKLQEVEMLGKVFADAAPTVSTAPGGEPTLVVRGQYQSLSSAAKEKYAVKKLLGKGGMGEVYLAEDKRLKRTVALKILPPEVAENDELRLRLLREAQAVAQISHPNVVAVFDVGEEARNSYISMEYVEGQSLRDAFKSKGPFDPKECVELLLQITDGLGCAHEKGIVHRDMKPENVMLTRDGTAKIMDFGLAVMLGVTRLTMPGGISGTWSYMAPEQVLGQADLTPAVDVYAVGCMAYELLSGSPPFTGDDVGPQHLAAAPRPLNEVRAEVPAALSDVVMKCLKKEPEDRYPDAAALNVALREVLRGL